MVLVESTENDNPWICNFCQEKKGDIEKKIGEKVKPWRCSEDFRSSGTNKSIVMSSRFSVLFRYFVFCVLSCIASSTSCQRTMTPVMILSPGVPTTKRMIPRKRRKMS